MPEHYLVGELSVRLAQLCRVASHTRFEGAATQLRREAENEPAELLARPLRRALALGDQLCWDSLTRGETSAFSNQVEVCAELHDFGICARLLAD